jgi:hypothetical protein
VNRSLGDSRFEYYYTYIDIRSKLRRGGLYCFLFRNPLVFCHFVRKTHIFCRFRPSLSGALQSLLWTSKVPKKGNMSNKSGFLFCVYFHCAASSAARVQQIFPGLADRIASLGTLPAPATVARHVGPHAYKSRPRRVSTCLGRRTSRVKISASRPKHLACFLSLIGSSLQPKTRLWNSGSRRSEFASPLVSESSPHDEFAKTRGGRRAIQKPLNGSKLSARHLASIGEIQGTLCISDPTNLRKNGRRRLQSPQNSISTICSEIIVSGNCE